MKFLCDEMLQGLGRWLRAAGYDTLVAENGEADKELLHLALAQGRLFITRDRELFEQSRADRDHILLLDSADLPSALQEVSERLGINWANAPFSRCLVCNQPLQAAPSEQRASAPGDVLEKGGPLLYCPLCDRVYWEGSHVRRMRKRLREFAQGKFNV